jgi:hypothetical protein
MNTRFQHLSHGHAGHENSFAGLGLRASRAAIPVERVALARNTQPLDLVDARVVSLPKKAALYTMNFPAEQCLTRPAAAARNSLNQQLPKPHASCH